MRWPSLSYRIIISLVMSITEYLAYVVIYRNAAHEAYAPDQ